MIDLEAQRTLDAIVLAIHCAFPFKDSLQARMCETGENYITICSGGVKLEGGDVKYHQTAQRAVLAYGFAMMEYAVGAEGRLLWRTRPELGRYPGGWAVFSRLIITDRPIDQKLLEEFHADTVASGR